MCSCILMPLDGSPIAEQVMPLAKMLAAYHNSTGVLFHAVKPICDTLRVEGEVFYADEQIETLRWQALDYLKRVGDDFARAGISIERKVHVGTPALAILEFAERASTDLISMATHGRDGSPKPLISVRSLPKLQSTIANSFAICFDIK